jgi:hypothetical protein
MPSLLAGVPAADCPPSTCTTSPPVAVSGVRSFIGAGDNVDLVMLTLYGCYLFCVGRGIPDVPMRLVVSIEW